MNRLRALMKFHRWIDSQPEAKSESLTSGLSPPLAETRLPESGKDCATRDAGPTPRPASANQDDNKATDDLVTPRHKNKKDDHDDHDS